MTQDSLKNFRSMIENQQRLALNEQQQERLTMGADGGNSNEKKQKKDYCCWEGEDAPPALQHQPSQLLTTISKFPPGSHPG